MHTPFQIYVYQYHTHIYYIIHASVCKMTGKKILLILLDENLNLSEYGIDFICIFMDIGDKNKSIYPWRAVYLSIMWHVMCVTCVCYGYDEFEIDNGIQFIIKDGFFFIFNIFFFSPKQMRC